MSGDTTLLALVVTTVGGLATALTLFERRLGQVRWWGVVAALVGAAIGGVLAARAGDDEQAKVVTQYVTGDRTIAITAPARVPLPETVGLSQLDQEGAVGFAPGADFGPVTIAGRDYHDGVRLPVYPDGSGVSRLAIVTGRRFSRISGVVGIDNETQCPGNSAIVGLSADGRSLFHRRRVRPNRGFRFSFPISDLGHVELRQSSLARPNGCGYGIVDVAWGDLRFTKR